MATPVSKITGIGIGGSSSSGASGQIQSSDGAGGFVGSAAIRAEVVTVIDATNPQLLIGTAGNGVMLVADGGALHLLNEIATEFASVVVNRLIAVANVTTDVQLSSDGSYKICTPNSSSYSGFRAASSSGVWWGNTVTGAEADANIDVGILRDASGVLASVLAAGGYADFKVRDLIATSLIYFGQFTTGAAPTYVKGASYFDTTLNKLRIGGASAWETVTSV